MALARRDRHFFTGIAPFAPKQAAFRATKAVY
jgi:hypothetical protein